MDAIVFNTTNAHTKRDAVKMILAMGFIWHTQMMHDKLGTSNVEITEKHWGDSALIIYPAVVFSAEPRRTGELEEYGLDVLHIDDDLDLLEKKLEELQKHRDRNDEVLQQAITGDTERDLRESYASLLVRVNKNIAAFDRSMETLEKFAVYSGEPEFIEVVKQLVEFKHDLLEFNSTVLKAEHARQLKKMGKEQHITGDDKDALPPELAELMEQMGLS